MSVAKDPPLPSNGAGSNIDSIPATTEQFFSLRWNNQTENFASVFHQLLESQSFVDVSLACEDHILQVHKVVLSACSSFFKRILLANPCKHPTIIMPAEIAFEDLRSIIEFIYRGEIDVPEGSLQVEFIQVHDNYCLVIMEHLLAYAATDQSDHQWQPPILTSSASHAVLHGGGNGFGVDAQELHQYHHQHQHHLHHQEFVHTSEIYHRHEPNITYAYEIRPWECATVDAAITDYASHNSYGAGIGLGFDDYQLGKGILHTAEQLQIKGLSDIQEMGDFSADIHADMAVNQATTTELHRNTSQNRQSMQQNDSQSVAGSVGAQASRANAGKLTQSDARSATQQGTRRQRAKRMRPYPAGATSSSAATADTHSASVQTDHGFANTAADANKWTAFAGEDDLQSDDATDNGSNVYITTAESIVDGSDDGGSGCDADAGGVAVTAGGDALMSESMGYLDFAAEPAAPAATPVAVHVEQIESVRGVGAIKTIGDNCNDIRGTSTPAKAVTMQFQTLLPMEHDRPTMIGRSAHASRTNNNVSLQSTTQQVHTLHHPQQQTITTAASTVGVVSPPCDTIIISGTETQNQSHGHDLQQNTEDHILHMHSVDLLDDGTTQEITIDPEDSMIMDIDHGTVKQEQQQHHLHQQDGHVVEVAANDGTQQTMSDSHMVTMMTSTGHLVEMYQSDTSEDSKMTDLNEPIEPDCGEEMDNNPPNDDDDEAQKPAFMQQQKKHHHHIPTTTAGGQTSVATITRVVQPAASSASSSATSTPDARSVQVTASPKTWTQANMDSALEALRAQTMSLTRASVTFGIPSTTLWQRAHRLGIDTPKKEGPSKTWSDDSLNNALEALRNGEISANKASKAYGIPSSTLYKIARREGIRLAAPFNAAPTNWSVDDLERALESIRSGATSVQKASLEFGIPTGTLYGRCKREGIELSRSNPTPWSEENMMEALESVRLGHQSINQAAIHFNLPYSSLYGRFKRGKFDVNVDGGVSNPMDQSLDNSFEFSPNTSNFAEITQPVLQQSQADQPQVVYRVKAEQS